MNKCLNCGKELKHTEGKRQRKFCDNKNKCKQEYHNRNKTKEPKYVQFSTFKELKEMNDKLLAQIENASFPPFKKETYQTKGVIASALDNPKPIKMEGESGFDYGMRVSQWKKLNLKK